MTQQINGINWGMSYENRTPANKICNMILLYGYVTNPMLVETFNLTLQTVTCYTQQLRQNRIIVPGGKAPSTGGKPPTKYILNKDYTHSLGIDITDHTLTFVLMDFMCNVIASEEQNFPFSYSREYFMEVARRARDFVESQPGSVDLLNEYVGVSVPGIISGNVVSRSHILGLQEADFSALGRCLNARIILVNDSNSGALSEAYATKERNFIYLSLSHTVGGGIVASGFLMQGKNNRSGEVGHMTLIPMGRSCYCGKDGCVDPYLCESALLGNEFDTLDEFFTCIYEGPSYTDRSMQSRYIRAEKRLQSYLKYLGMILDNLSMLCDTPIILGGTVGPYLKPYLTEINTRARKRSLFSDVAPVASGSIESTPAAFGAALICVTQTIANFQMEAETAGPGPGTSPMRSPNYGFDGSFGHSDDRGTRSEQHSEKAGTARNRNSRTTAGAGRTDSARASVSPEHADSSAASTAGSSPANADQSKSVLARTRGAAAVVATGATGDSGATGATGATEGTAAMAQEDTASSAKSSGTGKSRSKSTPRQSTVELLSAREQKPPRKNSGTDPASNSLQSLFDNDISPDESRHSLSELVRAADIGKNYFKSRKSSLPEPESQLNSSVALQNERQSASVPPDAEYKGTFDADGTRRPPTPQEVAAHTIKKADLKRFRAEVASINEAHRPDIDPEENYDLVSTVPHGRSKGKKRSAKPTAAETEAEKAAALANFRPRLNDRAILEAVSARARTSSRTRAKEAAAAAAGEPPPPRRRRRRTSTV